VGADPWQPAAGGACSWWGLRSRATVWRVGAPVWHIVFSPDGTVLATAETVRPDKEEYVLHVRRVRDGAVLQTLHGHTDIIHSAAFSHDGQLLAASKRSGLIRLWRVRDGTLVHLLDGRTTKPFQYVPSLIFTPDDRTLVAIRGTLVQRWAVDNGQVLETTVGQQPESAAIALSPSGRLVASRAVGKIYIWQRPGRWFELSTLLTIRHCILIKINTCCLAPMSNWWPRLMAMIGCDYITLVAAC
jgi:WD40 repeat protein